ncbi:MAG: lytic transglycosylase domain-containing protein [Dysgonamonadaceae bacterium]|jgi:hypothetical protein|nr:lytic transglycosylase domain-containing protein [Dysgonamonadaceae bacterium]
MQQTKNAFRMMLITGIILLFTAFLSGSRDSEETTVPQPVVSSFTVSVPIPPEITLCNETIDLQRLDMRERFDREINSLTYLHASTLLSIKRANRFFPLIEPILKRNGIPDDFKYLCVIESQLDPRAYSPSKAAGLWQFLESTARTYGLEIRDGVDERYHTEKATEAACLYFKEAYGRYGNWINTIASYNGGMSRISSEMQKQQEASAFDLLLVSETSRYVFRMMAVKEIFEHPQEYGFILKREHLYPPVPVHTVEVSTDIPDWATFAKEHELSYMQLKEYNVWLRDTKLVMPAGEKKTYRIAIPKKEDLYFNKKRNKVHNKAWIVDN